MGDSNISKSETSSPVVGQKPRIITSSSFSVSSSPSSPNENRSNKIAKRIIENEKNRREMKKLLLDGHQKFVIIPAAGKRMVYGNGNGIGGAEAGKRFLNIPGGPTGRWKPMNPNLRSAQASPSLRSLKTNITDEKRMTTLLPPSPSLGSFVTSDIPITTNLRPLSADNASARSLISVAMGSTDGKRLVISRVPTSPTELLNIVCPPLNGSDDEDDHDHDNNNYPSTGSSMGTMAESGIGGGHCKSGMKKKYRWSNKLQFILACVGYSVGLGNLWRLPYICYKSGGGVFFIPYFFIWIMCAVPLLYMELAIGQLTRRGPIGAFSKLCPIFKGVGLSNVAISFFLSTYYNVIISYTLFYLFSSFRSEPPWNNCNNRWNTAQCWKGDLLLLNKTRPAFSKTPAEEFYTKKVLQQSTGFDDIGEIRWELMACMLILWIAVYFALWKSIRSSGRVFYFTATVPFILVFLFLGHSLSLPGAVIGLKYLFNPKWHLLLDSKVWVNAAAQNLNSVGIALGSVISFSSYNRYNNNQIVRDTLTVSIINGVTSLLVAIFAFSTIGNIAFEQKATIIDDIITDGPGLAFIVYPQALSTMPFMGFWAALFFFAFLLLGLNSQFAVVEVIVTSLQDGFPHWMKRKFECHEILVLVVCLVSFVIGLFHVTQGGIFFLQLLDYYVASIAIIYVAFFEVISIGWIYGTDQLSADIEKMTGQKPIFFFNYCWKIGTPLMLMCVWIFSLLDFEPLTYNNEGYIYPAWSQFFGWLIAVSILLLIPIVSIYVVIHSEGDSLYQKFLRSMKPHFEGEYGIPRSMEKVHSKELNNLLEYKITTAIIPENNNTTLANHVINQAPNHHHHQSRFF